MTEGDYFEELLRLVKQRDATAQFNLGEMYQYGQGVPQDYKEAEKWYRLAAEQGNLDAQIRLAFGYYFGEGIPRDHEEAAKWYRLAADQGDETGQFWLGFICEMATVSPRTTRTPRSGIVWRRNRETQWRNGASAGCMSEAKVSPQDYKEALKWYRRAAEQGHEDAQYRLGIMYEAGQGVPQDYIQAHTWFNLAGARLPGEVDGVKNRHIVAAKMTPDQIAEAQRLAREWKPKTSR